MGDSTEQKGTTAEDLAEYLEHLSSVPKPLTAKPVKVDNVTRQSGDQALEGLFCDVVSGPYAGRWGVFEQVVDRDAKGYPKTIFVVTRDERNERLEVAYTDCRPSAKTGGR